MSETNNSSEALYESLFRLKRISSIKWYDFIWFYNEKVSNILGIPEIIEDHSIEDIMTSIAEAERNQVLSILNSHPLAPVFNILNLEEITEKIVNSEEYQKESEELWDTYYELWKYTKAIYYYNIIKDTPLNKNWEIYVKLWFCYDGLQDYDRAIDNYENAIWKKGSDSYYIQSLENRILECKRKLPNIFQRLHSKLKKN